MNEKQHVWPPVYTWTTFPGSFFVYRMQMKHIVEPLFVSHCILVQYCILSFVSIILRHLCPVHQVRAHFRRYVKRGFPLSRWSLVLATRTNGTKNSGRNGQTENKSNTLEGIIFFLENFRWNEPFHFFPTGTTSFFIRMVSALGYGYGFYRHRLILEIKSENGHEF